MEDSIHGRIDRYYILSPRYLCFHFPSIIYGFPKRHKPRLIILSDTKLTPINYTMIRNLK